MLNKKWVRYTLIAVLLTTFTLSAAMLAFTVFDHEKAKADFDELAKIVNTPVESTPATSEEVTTTPDIQTETKAPTTPVAKPIITRNIAKLKQMNKECVGWVYIKGTKVNYPVMYTPKNPEKYLNRNFYNEYSGSGVPFIDARCNLKSTNIIIYSHNMKNLTMFGGLRKYLDKTYLKNHQIIEFETLDGLCYYKITQVKKTDINDSWFRHNITGKQDGKEYLTLSTCYGTNKNARLLIIAEKIDPGEK